MAKNNGNTPVETQQKGTPITQGSRPPAQIRETEVTLWLKENNAGEFAPKFLEKGFRYIKDITEKDLDELIKDKPGIRNMLARLIKEEKEKPVPEIPKLPEGTKWDLTSKELELPDGIKFEIPNALQVPKDDKVVVSPGSLTPDQWMVVARNSCLLYGRRMDGVEPVTAAYPVLYWKVPKGNNFMRSEHLAAEVKSELTYTESSSNYVRQGFSKVNATLSVPYCAASVEREDNEKHAACAKTKQLFMTGIWNYPRARVLLEECTVVSPQFVEEIREALGLNPDLANMESKGKDMGLDAEQPSESQQQAAKQAIVNVERVLLRYGHIVGWNVEVGGRLFFVYHKQVTGTVNSHEEQATTGAAVGIKTGAPIDVKAEVGVKVGEGQANRDEALYIAETTTFTALGGDTTLASNPQAWALTVKDPNLWAVIGIPEAKSTVDLVPEPLYSFVKRIWKKYGRRGHLDGRSVRLRTCQTFRRPYLTFVPDSFRRVEERCLYMPDEDPIWNIRCFRGDIYWMQHKKSGNFMGGELASYSSAYIEDPSRSWRATWHIHPVDPDGTYGDQYRDSYLLELIEEGALLMAADNDSQTITLVRLPLTEFSLDAKYVFADDPNDPGRLKDAPDKVDKFIHASQLVWKLESVEDV